MAKATDKKPDGAAGAAQSELPAALAPARSPSVPQGCGALPGPEAAGARRSPPAFSVT